jgi:hypothetical protein
MKFLEMNGSFEKVVFLEATGNIYLLLGYNLFGLVTTAYGTVHDNTMHCFVTTLVDIRPLQVKVMANR